MINWILCILGWEGNMPICWHLLYIAVDIWILAWDLLGCAFDNFYLPWTLRTMSNLGLGVHLRNTILLSFKILRRIFQILAIMSYLSMLCLLRLFFTWSNEELCIFAIVWFRLTSCHLGCHWTKCVNLFLLMLSELSNLLEG